MKTLTVILIVCLFSSSDLIGQSLPEIGKEGIELLTKQYNDTTYVVNFWATWCSPCVKEIGYFEELHRKAGDSKLKVILVSLDFPNQVERRVLPFLKEKEITATVMLVTDLNYNGWIDLVDPSWSGALPATLIYNRDSRVFLEKELTRDALFEQVNQILN